MAVDIAGYSRLMGTDEEGTLHAVRAIWSELTNPKIAEHRGRIVKTIGDGLLGEFASVIDAVRCAVEVQRAMAERNVGVPTERRIEFRIGINLGDIIVEDGDIFGDDVNIAARLEGLAKPGGIWISGTVRDRVGARLPYAFEDVGEQSVKNIVKPVRAYAKSAAAVAATPLVPVQAQTGPDYTSTTAATQTRTLTVRLDAEHPATPAASNEVSATQSFFSPDQLGKTMANPRYADDISRLDRIYDRNAVINRETIIIIVGISVPAELMDRPVAESLRDHIDARGGEENPFRRAIVLTDEAWYAEARYISANAVISVGGPPTNKLSKEFNEWAAPPGSYQGKFSLQGKERCTGFYRLNQRGLPQVALWGIDGRTTREAVEYYINTALGLDEFLIITWNLSHIP